MEGTVTLDEQPLPDATVVFAPENGRTAGARTDANGHYVLNFSRGRQGAIPGRNVVRIFTRADASEDAAGNEIPAASERVPSKYNASTTLEFNVEPGKKNIADFDLDSKGPIDKEPGGY